MTQMDPIADALIAIKNSERAAKSGCEFRPAPKLLMHILDVMKDSTFISGYKRIEDGREGIYRVSLNGRINECRAIKPRYSVGKEGFEKFEKRFLPARNVGILIVSTPQGVMNHKQAMEKKTGGRLLAYVY